MTNGDKAAKLALIASAITTIGDMLATVAAALALEEEQQTTNSQNHSRQKQINQLQTDMAHLKKHLRHHPNN